MGKTVHKLAAHQEVAPPRQVDLGIAAAVERQTAAMRELSHRAFPETDVAVPEDAPASIEQVRAERRRQTGNGGRRAAPGPFPLRRQPVKWHEPAP